IAGRRRALVALDHRRIDESFRVEVEVAVLGRQEGLELRSLLARGDARPEVVEEVGRDPRRAHETAKTPVLAKRDQTFIEILRDDVDPPVPVDADLERAVIEVRRNNPREIGFRPPDDPDLAPLSIEWKVLPVACIGVIEVFGTGYVKPA